MKVSKISKNLYLVLIIGVIAIGIVIFIQTELPAQKPTLILPPTLVQPQTTTQPTPQIATSTQSQIDTSEMEIYINEKHGFEFKYPMIYEKFKGCGIREENGIIYLGNRIQLQIVDSQGLSLNEYVNQYINQNLRTDLVKEYQSKDVSISGNYAIKITYRLTGIGRFGETVFLFHKGKVYKFSFLAGPSCIKDILELETLQQILSTFKFIDK